MKIAMICWGRFYKILNLNWNYIDGPILPIKWKKNYIYPKSFNDVKDSIGELSFLVNNLIIDNKNGVPYIAYWCELNEINLDNAINFLSNSEYGSEDFAKNIGYINLSTFEKTKGEEGWRCNEGIWMINLIYEWAKSKNLGGIIWDQQEKPAVQFDDNVYNLDLLDAFSKCKLVYFEGNYNLILGCPHGGRIKLLTSTRKKILCGDIITTGTDICTAEMALTIRQNLQIKSEEEKNILHADIQVPVNVPSLVILCLDRSWIECNNPWCKIEGCECCFVDNNEVKNLYFKYHHYLRSSIDRSDYFFHRNLFIDIHGLSTEYNNLSLLGYCIEPEVLFGNDEKKLIQELKNNSSISTLAKEQLSDEKCIKLLRSSTDSLGGILSVNEITCVPPNNLTKNLTYFKGGYCTKLYGSLSGFNKQNFNTDAIQIETAPQLRETLIKSLKFGINISKGIYDFHKKYYS